MIISPIQAIDIASKAGFRFGHGLIMSVAIAIAESNLLIDAVNVNDDKWNSRDRGLWQINDHWHPEVSDVCAFNPECCAKAAFKISKEGTYFTPWATFKQGKYKKHMILSRTAYAAWNCEKKLKKCLGT